MLDFFRWYMAAVSGVALCLGLGLSAQDPATDAPVLSSDFEQDLGPWQVSHGTWAIDKDVSHHGQGSLRLTNATSVRTDFLDLNGAAWHLSYWMKTRDVQRGPKPWHRAGAQISFYDEQRRPVGKGHSDIGLTLGTTDWTQHQRTIFFAPKQGVRYIRVALMNWNCTGTTWFDDVRIVSAPLPEAYRKVPPLKEVENQPPRIWPLPQVTPTDVAIQDLLPRDYTSMPLRVIRQSQRIAHVPEPTPDVRGIDIDRGYMTRLVRREIGGPGPDGLRFERYDETFRGSAIWSCFPRFWLGNDATVGDIVFTFRITGPITAVQRFRGNTLTEEDLSTPFTLGPDTTKPFVIFSNGDAAGVVLFHPIPPEVRRWHVEDLVVENEVWPEVSCTQLAGGDWEVTYRFRDMTTGSGGHCHSFDFYTFVRPYRGSLDAALSPFQLGQHNLLSPQAPFSGNHPRGYWEPFMGMNAGARLSRMARYFPREFSSWTKSAGWDYGHPNGHGWGNMTTTMKGIRVNPNADTDLARDHAWRMLTFFLAAAGKTGAPPNLATWRAMAANFDDVSEHYTTVFCQYWEWRLGEFRAWLRESDRITDAEKQRIYTELQRARAVYDPAKTDSTWSYPTPNGGLWFEYHDKPRGRRRWVINTHATSVGNVGDFALLARERGDAAGEAFWTELFQRGVDGLIFAWQQDDMWTDHDPNEVRYARPPDGGPRGYHRYMVTAWTHTIVELAMELGNYRLDDIVHYWKRMAAAEYTTDRNRERIAPLLERAEAQIRVR